MISVYFNTTLDGYYQDELGSSNFFVFFFYMKKIVSSEVLLMLKFLIASSEVWWVMSVQAKEANSTKTKVGVDR